MKKIMLLFTAVLFVTGSFAASVINPEISKLKASEIFIPVGNSGKIILLMELSAISTKDFQFLTGKKMSFFERLSFKLGQKKLKNMINADGTINNRMLSRLKSFQHKKSDDNSDYFVFGGFCLGLFLGPLGVLICATGHRDNKKAMVTAAWIGFGVMLLIILLAKLLKAAL